MLKNCQTLQFISKITSHLLDRVGFRAPAGTEGGRRIFKKTKKVDMCDTFG